MVRTTYKGYGLEISGDETVVVQWGVIHARRKTAAEAKAFVDGRISAQAR